MKQGSFKPVLHGCSLALSFHYQMLMQHAVLKGSSGGTDSKLWLSLDQEAACLQGGRDGRSVGVGWAAYLSHTT